MPSDMVPDAMACEESLVRAKGLWAPGGPRMVNGVSRRNHSFRTSLKANCR